MLLKTITIILLIKVVIIFGLNGACRQGELYKLSINDIEDTGKIVVVTLHDTKTKKKEYLPLLRIEMAINYIKNMLIYDLRILITIDSLYIIKIENVHHN